MIQIHNHSVLILPSSALTQLNFNFNFEAEIALFSDNKATHTPNHPTGKVIKWSKTSNSSIEDVK